MPKEIKFNETGQLVTAKRKIVSALQRRQLLEGATVKADLRRHTLLLDNVEDEILQHALEGYPGSWYHKYNIISGSSLLFLG